MHKAVDGAAKTSYGIQVAKLAGIPIEVLKSARENLYRLENKASIVEINSPQISFELEEKKTTSNPLKETLDSIDINSMTPIEALNILQTLKNMNENK